MNLRIALLALPLALAACGDQANLRMPWDKPEPVAPVAPVVAGPPTIPPPPQVSPVDQPLQVGEAGAARATAERETVDLTAAAAAGPGWAVEVAGESATFSRPGAKSATVPVRRIVYARGVEFVGELNDVVFSLNVTPADCGASPLTATLRANRKTFAGCAAPAGTPAAAALAQPGPVAPAAPVPAAPAGPAAPAASAPATAAAAPSAAKPAQG